jgi:hypothetical protein
VQRSNPGERRGSGLRSVLRGRAREKASAIQEALLDQIPHFGRQPDESLLVVADAWRRYDAPIRHIKQLIEERYFGCITTERSATDGHVGTRIRPRTTTDPRVRPA